MKVFATEKRRSCIGSRNTSLWRHNDVFRDEIRVIAPHMLNQKKLQFWSYAASSFLRCEYRHCFFVVNPFKFWPYMAMWREIWISLITCNSTPFYPNEMGVSPEFIEFYTENYYQGFTVSFLNFLFNAKFGHHIWRHNSSDIGWNKHQWEDNLAAYLPAKFGYVRWILLLFMA